MSCVWRLRLWTGITPAPSAILATNYQKLAKSKRSELCNDLTQRRWDETLQQLVPQTSQAAQLLGGATLRDPTFKDFYNLRQMSLLVPVVAKLRSPRHFGTNRCNSGVVAGVAACAGVMPVHTLSLQTQLTGDLSGVRRSREAI